MPTYEYKCDACGHPFEKFQSITAPAIRKCPKCGKNKVRRLISAGAGLIFKGSGFYITDYRDSGYSDKAKADTESKAAESRESKPAAESKPTESKSGDSKSESKPQTKPESKPAESKPAAKSETKSESKPARPSKSKKD
jgi:putative FmdB family regulatory protein